MADINFKTAILAKEKEFPDLGKRYAYNKDGMVVDPFYSESVCEIQSQDDLKTWLREKHRIHITISPWKESFVSSGRKQNRTMYEGNIINEKDSWRIVQINSFSKKYEDCMDECLVFALELIIK
jgi:hypothetical protein